MLGGSPASPPGRRRIPDVQLKNWRPMLAKGLDSLLWVQYVGDPYAEVVVHDDDFARGDGPVVDQDVHRLARQLLELDYGAGAERPDAADGHSWSAKLD